jgi:hypothetical protein
MTSREARLASPKLLPGVAAGTWARAGRWVFVVSLVLMACGFAIQFLAPLKHVIPFSGLILFIPGIIVSFALQLSTLAGFPREKAEVTAGYTTLPHKYPNLEQLDPSTGAVLRAAGEPYLPRSRRHQVRDAETGSDDVTRPSLVKRVAPTLIGTVGGAVFLIVVYFALGLLNNSELTVILVIVSGFLVLFAVATLIGSLRVRRVLTSLSAAAPNEFEFVFGTSNGLISALQALVPVDDVPNPQLARARQATASTAGLTFWQGTPPTSVATLPWSKVIAVQQVVIQFGRSANPAVVVTFRDEEAEEVVALTLMNAEANSVAIHSVAEARWIASELNQLRTGNTVARLI